MSRKGRKVPAGIADSGTEHASPVGITQSEDVRIGKQRSAGWQQVVNVSTSTMSLSHRKVVKHNLRVNLVKDN